MNDLNKVYSKEQLRNLSFKQLYQIAIHWKVRRPAPSISKLREQLYKHKHNNTETSSRSSGVKEPILTTNEDEKQKAANRKRRYRETLTETQKENDRKKASKRMKRLRMSQTKEEKQKQRKMARISMRKLRAKRREEKKTSNPTKAETSSRQLKYYYRNRTQILDKKAEKLLLTKLEKYKPFAAYEKGGCSCKYNNQRTRFEIPFQKFRCYQCLGDALSWDDELKEDLMSIDLDIFQSKNGCVSCGRKPISVTHAQVESFAWRNVGWCFDCCKKIMDISLNTDWKAFYRVCSRTSKYIQCHFCDRTNTDFYFYDFQQNMLMCQKCLAIVQVLLKAQTETWWTDLKPKNQESIIFSSTPKSDLISESIDISDVLWNETLIKSNVIITNATSMRRNTPLKERVFYKNEEGFLADKVCKRWMEYSVFPDDLQKRSSLNVLKDKNRSWSRKQFALDVKKEKQVWFNGRCPECNISRKALRCEGNHSYWAEDNGKLCAKCGEPLKVIDCPVPMPFHYSTWFETTLTKPRRCSFMPDKNNIKKFMVISWSKIRKNYVKGKLADASPEETNLRDEMDVDNAIESLHELDLDVE